MTGVSLQRERRQLARALRAEGRTWVDVAVAVRERYGVNARVAFRWAQAWTQEQVARAWCDRWPDDPRTRDNISTWERWPESGHEPSLTTLSRLAEIYECSVADLVADLADYRHRDAHHDGLTRTAPANLTPVPPVDPDPAAWLSDLSDTAERMRWLTTPSVDTDTLERLYELIDLSAAAYETATATALYGVVLRQRRDVDQWLCRSHSPQHRADLFRLAGRLSVLLSHFAFDLAAEPLADAYSSEAATLAELCGDDELLARAHVTQSFLAYYRGRYDTAAGYAVEAARHAPSGAEGIRAAISHARALARLGDGRGVDQAIGRAFELQQRLTIPDAPSPFLGFEPWDTSRIAGNAATAYLSLGRTEKAVEHAHLAVPTLRDSGAHAGQALTHLDAASALLSGETRDLERAAHAARQALESCDGLSSLVLARRFHEFRYLADQWHDERPIADIIEQMEGHPATARPAGT